MTFLFLLLPCVNFSIINEAVTDCQATDKVIAAVVKMSTVELITPAESEPVRKLNAAVP